MPTRTLTKFAAVAMVGFALCPSIAHAGDRPIFIVGGYGVGEIGGRYLIYLGSRQPIVTPIPSGRRWLFTYIVGLGIVACGFGLWLDRRRNGSLLSCHMKMNRFTPVVLFLFTLAGCDENKHSIQSLPSKTKLPTPILAASTDPVILIYQDSWGKSPQVPGNHVEVAVWSDGRIVWRANDSLLQARMDTMKINELLQRLHKEGVFGDGKVHYDNFGPDSGFDVIGIRLADRQLQLRSWHEVFEQNPKLVVTSHGVSALEGRNRDAVLAAEPQEYRRFRRVWSDIRSVVKSWVPNEGEPFTGTVSIGRGG